MIELVSVLEAFALEGTGQRTIGVVDFEHLRFGVMRAGAAAEHVSKLGPIESGVGGAVDAAKSTAFADEAQQALANFGIRKHHANDAIEEDRVVLLDFR